MEARSGGQAVGPFATQRDWRMLIAGELMSARHGEVMDVVNPAEETVVAAIPAGTAEDVDRAVAAARAAFPQWRDTPAVERAAAISALADEVEAHAEELAWLDTIDIGTPIRTMRGDSAIATAQLRFFAGLALMLRGATIPTPDGYSLDFTIPEPFGVVGRIIPFNHPHMFAASKLAAPLVAGNTVVLKPSQWASMSALRLGELAAAIFPPGVVNIVTGRGTIVGECLVRHPDVPRLAFTGASSVGQHIQQCAAESGIKSVTLELGGKNPIVVFPDADIGRAVDGALHGMNFTWQGQSCGSTSRLFVHRSVFDDFIDQLATAMDGLLMGDPTSESTDTGAMANADQYAKVRSYIEIGLESGKLITGGLPDPRQFGRGFFVRPTLFTIDRPDKPIAREEIFGPVLVAIPFETYGEVIRAANAVPFGLTASVWTRDLELALRAAKDLEVGYVWVNSSSIHIPGAPFGGVKRSGVGREEGLEELYSYTQTKNVMVQMSPSNTSGAPGNA